MIVIIDGLLFDVYKNTFNSEFFILGKSKNFSIER